MSSHILSNPTSRQTRSFGASTSEEDSAPGIRMPPPTRNPSCSTSGGDLPRERRRGPAHRLEAEAARVASELAGAGAGADNNGGPFLLRSSDGEPGSLGDGISDPDDGIVKTRIVQGSRVFDDRTEATVLATQARSVSFTNSAESLIDWQSMIRAGRAKTASKPTTDTKRTRMAKEAAVILSRSCGQGNINLARPHSRGRKPSENWQEGHRSPHEHQVHRYLHHVDSLRQKSQNDPARESSGSPRSKSPGKSIKSNDGRKDSSTGPVKVLFESQIREQKLGLE